MNRAQLVAAERWLLADELSSHMRHKVRNKLGSVRNAAFFIRRSLEKSATPPAPRLLTFFQLIDDELCAADQHLGHQPAAMPGSGALLERLQLRACIDAALALRGLLPALPTALPTSLEVTVRCNPALTLTGRAAELTVALCCLLDNACEAVAPGGRIAIAAIPLPEPASHIALSVTDSGAGFTQGAAEQALEAFFTTKPGHLGLGLNLVARVLKDHGGRIHIDARVCPAARTEAAPASCAAGCEGPCGARINLLLPQAPSEAAPPRADAEE